MTTHTSEWTEPIRLELIVGSVRDGRFGPVVAGWFEGFARRRDELDLGVLDLADDPEDFAARVAAAHAVVVVTPEYNHSFPGPLKTAIDGVYQGWHATAVGFVSYGGLSGGLRAVEQLRTVFAELHAVTVRHTVSFHMAHGEFDEHGRPRDREATEQAAGALLEQLVWWGRALRSARHHQPYVS